MNANDTAAVKFVGSLYGAIVGSYAAEVSSLSASYGGNLALLLHNLSATASFKSTLTGANDRANAHDLVNRLVGDTVSPAAYKVAVDYFADKKAAGQSWGQIVFDAVDFLGKTQDPTWLGAGKQLNARADYNVKASENWASKLSDISTLRDVYSFAISPVVTLPAQFKGLEAPLTALSKSDLALGASVSTLGAQSPSQIYAVSAGDVGKAVFMGAGDDTVSIGYSELGKLAFLSGGDGYDTLKIIGDSTKGQAYVDFMNVNQGLYSNLAIRGFENIVFSSYRPYVIGSIDGVKKYDFSLLFKGDVVDAKLGSVDDGTIFNIDTSLGGGNGQISFFDNFKLIDEGKGLGFLGAPARAVESLIFNLKGPDSQSLGVAAPPAKIVEINLSGTTSDAKMNFQFARFGDRTPSNDIIETLKYSSSVAPTAATVQLPAPNLKTLDASTSSERVEFFVTTDGARVNDGVVDYLTVKPSKGLTAIKWSTDKARADTVVKFDGELKAGSYVGIDYSAADGKTPLPTVKGVFNNDFSQINFYNNSPEYPLGAIGDGSLKQVAGSVWNVKGVNNTAVYFKGVAPEGQKIGTVVVGDYYQTTTVKVDSAKGLDVLDVGQYKSGVTAFINTSGQGSVLDNIKESLVSQMAASGSSLPLIEVPVAGGRLMYFNTDGFSGSTGAIMGVPGAVVTDLVFMETSSVNLAQFSNAIQLIGFNPIVDAFAM